MKLPHDLLVELDRLGENPAQVESIANSYGLDSARFYVDALTASSQQFDMWFPRIQQFARDRCKRNPLPADESLTPTDNAIRRILCPKIIKAKRVPPRLNFTATIFTARLVVLPLLASEWPSTYQNYVFLTPDEWKEWNERCDESGDDAMKRWYVLHYWDAEVNPAADSLWMWSLGEREDAAVGHDANKILIQWGRSISSRTVYGVGELWVFSPGDGESRISVLGQYMA